MAKKKDKPVKRQYEIPITECLCEVCNMFILRDGSTVCEWCKDKQSTKYKSVKMEEEYVSEKDSVDESDATIW